MTWRGRVQLRAGLAALGVFLLLLLGLRLRNWLPFVAAAAVYLGLLWYWRAESWGGRPARRPVALPDGVSRASYDEALAALGAAERELRALTAAAPAGDVPTVRRMAELVGSIRTHHEANPAHVPRTRAFVRHTLDRMVAAVAGYVDLAGRAAPQKDERDERLAEISRRLQGFLPVLERIDRACIENDLMALEISVEVLDEQLDRDREV